MARVQMLVYISGGHASGAEWPPAGETLDTSEQEARELVAGGLARWLPGGDTATAPPDTAQLAAETSPAAPAAGESPDAENSSEGAGKPRTRDPRDAWQMHAISLGASPEIVAAMTKSDLIAQFGN